MSVIVLNMISMACTFDGNPAWWVLILKYANYVFSAIFVVEASLKLFVYRRAYFYTAWNKFDFFVVSASILDITMDLMGGGIKALKVAPQLARVMRVLRVTRVLRLAGKNEGL
jgi:voltage-dependent calcium channel T type alpha-1I